MLKVGLTGGIACGKSVVAEMLAARGAYIAFADQIAHELMLPGGTAYEQVVRRFGRDILNPDASINRQKLADIVFAPAHQPGGRRKLDELNSIVHPAVIARQSAWAREIGERDPQAIAVVEAALILETGAGERFDKLIVVCCEPEQKVERLAKRLNVDRETARREVARRSAAQWPDAEKIRAADFIIYNTGTLAQTEAQVEKVFSELARLARR